MWQPLRSENHGRWIVENAVFLRWLRLVMSRVIHIACPYQWVRVDLFRFNHLSLWCTVLRLNRHYIDQERHYSSKVHILTKPANRSIYSRSIHSRSIPSNFDLQLQIASMLTPASSGFRIRVVEITRQRRSDEQRMESSEPTARVTTKDNNLWKINIGMQ